MREQDLVHRAERAATALEGAWMRWRDRHGLGVGPLPPVTSYVGYSVEEPWGQPRVVFGIAAAEAERIAAILDHDAFAGPVEAELRAHPDRLQAESPTVWAAPASTPGIQPQAGQPDHESARPMPGPLAGTIPAARQPQPPAVPGRSPARTAQDRPASPSAAASPRPPAPAAPDREVRPPAGPARAVRPPAAPDRKVQSRAAQDRKVQPPAARDAAVRPPAGPDHPGQPSAAGEVAAATAEPLTQPEDNGTATGQPGLPDALSQAAAVADLPPDLPDNEAAYLQELAARTVDRPGSVAARPRPAGLPETADAAAPAGTPWQPAPELGQPDGQGPDEAADLDGPQRNTAPAVTGDERRTAASRQVARLVPVSRRNRSRKAADRG